MRIFALLFIVLLSINQSAYGAVASCMELTHTDGLKKNICDKNNKGFLLLEFVMPACRACQQNVEKFKQLEDRNKLIAHSRIISLDSLENTIRFARNYNIITDLAVDNFQEARNAHNIRRVPAMLLLDNNNQVIYQKAGALSDQDIKYISDLIQNNN